jgi:hypothetical protein
VHRLKWFVRTPRRAVATLAALVVLGVTGYGIAAWLTTVAHPNAEVKIGTLTVTSATPSTAPGTNPCLPNGTCDGNIVLNNSSSNTLHITGFTAASLTGGSNVTATITGASGSCVDSTDIFPSFSIPAQTGLNIAVPPGTSTITIPNLFAVNNSIGTGCAGATVNFTFLAGFTGWVLTVST